MGTSIPATLTFVVGETVVVALVVVFVGDLLCACVGVLFACVCMSVCVRDWGTRICMYVYIHIHMYMYIII